MLDTLPFEEIWTADFEFVAQPGERPDVVCLVAHELRSGKRMRLWRDQLGPQPPYRTDASVLFVAYFASAEIGCHLALGWPVPERILDPFPEFRGATNGLQTVAGNGLVGALLAHGLDSIGVTEKEEMRALIMRGGPWADDERRAILDYCESDVDALDRLLLAMLDKIDLGRALLRGRYMSAVASMEFRGVPIDMEALLRLRQHWHDIQDRLIAAVDADYDVYDGRTFKVDRFANYLARQGIPWPRLDSGRLDLSGDTFRYMAKTWPAIAPIRELRHAMSEMRLNKLEVGRDGRNRCLLSPFGSKTGRNQPSNSKFIFGPSAWLRSLIKPPEGYALAYLDWSQQEPGIAAALSGDKNMLLAYESGDPYLMFAKLAGAVPAGATKQSHPDERALYKQTFLATLYGQGADALAQKLGVLPVVAYDLLRAHAETFRDFWKWSDRVVDVAMLRGSISTVFGWPVHVGADANPRSLANFPMQANGAEMLRLACCLATEAGIEVVAPVHDAVMIVAPLDRIEADVAAMQAFMRQASAAVLNGFELESDVKIVRWPERYVDERGAAMWDHVMRLIEEVEADRSEVA